MLFTDTLNGKVVSDTSRQFLLRMQQSRSRTSVNSSSNNQNPSINNDSRLTFSDTATPISASNTGSTLANHTVSGHSALGKGTPDCHRSSKYILPGLITTIGPRQRSSPKLTAVHGKVSGHGDRPLRQKESSGFMVSGGERQHALQSSPVFLPADDVNIPPPLETNEALAPKHSLGEETFSPEMWRLA